MEWEGRGKEVLRVGDHVRSYFSKREGFIEETLSGTSINYLTLRLTKCGSSSDCVGDIDGGFSPGNFFKTTNQIQKTEEVVDMDAAIVAVYEKTEDAVLVEKHFGGELKTTISSYDFTRTLWLKAHKAEYLAEAQRREEEENAATRTKA